MTMRRFEMHPIVPLMFLLIFISYTIKKIKTLNHSKLLCLALIFAGGIGNIIDRIFFDRHVPDFMIISIQNLRTGIFNFADVCVTIGAIGLLFFYRHKKEVSHT